MEIRYIFFHSLPICIREGTFCISLALAEKCERLSRLVPFKKDQQKNRYPCHHK